MVVVGVVVGRLTGVVVGFLRGVVVVVVDAGLLAGLVAGFVEGRLVLPPIIPPPVTPPESCCAIATLLAVINRTADRQIERGGVNNMTFSPALRPEMNRDDRPGIIVKNGGAWERLLRVSLFWLLFTQRCAFV